MIIDEQTYLFEGQGSECNIYAIIAEDGLVLVDTGLGNNTDGLLKRMRNSGLDPEKIKLIVNTHCHFDHIGGNHEIRERFGAAIGAHPPDSEHISNADPEYTASKYAQTKPHASNVSLLLAEGDRIEGTDLEVIHTPGHTAGSISLYSKSRHSLISGDTIFPGGHPGRMDLPGGSKDAMKTSLEKLSKLTIRAILPGHGEPELEGGHQSILTGLKLLGKEP